MRSLNVRLKALGAALLLGTSATACAEIGGVSDSTGNKVTVAQVVPTLGYLTLDTARAFDTFGAQKLEYKHVQLSGGDPAALAALDSGGVDFAAVGSEAPLLTLAKKAGEYQIVYALMGQMSLDLTVSKAFLAKAGVTPSDPLPKRLAALKGARFGVSALGGAQERSIRWTAKLGGLDPDKDIEIVNAGPPSALLAGMDNDRIDGFLLTEPNGSLAEKNGYGTVLVRLGSEVEQLKTYYHLVLVTRKDFAAKNPDKVVKVVRALNEANNLITGEPDRVAKELHGTEYSQVPVDVLTQSIKSLAPGVDSNGELTSGGITQIVKFVSDTGQPIVKDKLDVSSGQGDWWTNEYVEKAR